MSKYIDTEAQRIKQILDGKSEEYGYFVKTYSAQVLDFVSRMVSDAGDAEELAQDGFVKDAHMLFHLIIFFKKRARLAPFPSKVLPLYPKRSQPILSSQKTEREKHR